MDQWNQFPLLNNLLFAADAASDLNDTPQLPWQVNGATGTFPDAGLLATRRADSVIACGGQMGGAVKAWATDGTLLYEDCGYALHERGRWFVTQGEGEVQIANSPNGGLTLTVATAFRGIPSTRFDPSRFVAFRLFTTTLGRFSAVSRWLKDLLVKVLIRKKRLHPGKLRRTICIASNGTLTIDDAITGTASEPIPLPRHVPFHMGSSRYADFEDWCGAGTQTPRSHVAHGGYERFVTLEASPR